MNIITPIRHQAPRRLLKPLIYAAGRMSGCDGCKTDWRDWISGFVGLYALDGDICADATSIVDCGSFRYGGPFLTGSQTTGGHTLGHTAYTDPESHREIWATDRAQIERADLIVAYLDDVEAHGTLCEIGFAAALGKPVVIGFSDRMSDRDYRELWLCRMLAAEIYHGGPGAFWAQVRADWISGASPWHFEDDVVA